MGCPLRPVMRCRSFRPGTSRSRTTRVTCAGPVRRSIHPQRVTVEDACREGRQTLGEEVVQRRLLAQAATKQIETLTAGQYLLRRDRLASTPPGP